MNHQPITLEQLIEQLEQRPASQPVVFDFPGAVPGSLDSYRGYYDHLALSYRAHHATSETQTVGALLAVLNSAVGKVFTGYKGGDFRMGLDTPVWVANYGSSGHTCVAGVIGDDYWTIICTEACLDWVGGEQRAHDVVFSGLGFGNAHRRVRTERRRATL